MDALKDVPKVLLPQYSQEKFIQIAQVGSKVQEDGSWGSDKPNWVLHPESHFVLSVPLFPLACYFVKEHASLTPPKKFSFEDKYPCVSCLPFLYAGKIKIHFISLITGRSSILWRAVTPLRGRWIILDSRLFCPQQCFCEIAKKAAWGVFWLFWKCCGSICMGMYWAQPQRGLLRLGSSVV